MKIKDEDPEANHSDQNGEVTADGGEAEIFTPGEETEGQQTSFNLFDESVGELPDEGGGQRGVEAHFRHLVTASPKQVHTFLLLEQLRKIRVHQIWPGDGQPPEHFMCDRGCQLCLADESKDFLAGRVYLPDEDRGATLLISLFDPSKTLSISAVKEFKRLASEIGTDELWQMPFELSMETTGVGVRHVVIEADTDLHGEAVPYGPHDPEFLAAEAMREKLDDQPLLRTFSLDLDGEMLPKIAKRVQRKLGRKARA